MEETMSVESEEQESQPDAAFTQEFDGRSYHVRLFFPKSGAGTLQEKIEWMLRTEMMKIAEDNSATDQKSATISF